MLFKKILKIKTPSNWDLPEDAETLTVTAENFWPDGRPEPKPWDALTILAQHHKTDKWGRHFYTPHFDRIFKNLRKEPITLLEIGVGGYENPMVGGQSLRMWKEYFPKGTIVGIDVYDKSMLAEPRIDIIKGRQEDPELHAKLKKKYKEFDIIVDDGSHDNQWTQEAFHGLWPLLKEGGWYCIEDLQTSYWPPFGGSSEADRSGTTIEFLKTLIDCLNYEEIDLENYTPTVYDREIVAMEFYHNLVLIKKGQNNEGSPGIPVHPHERIFNV